MSETYIVFYYNEDGDRVQPEFLTKNSLEKRLNENYWGDKVKILTPSCDFEYETGILIIKGEVIKPKSVKVVQQWELWSPCRWIWAFRTVRTRKQGRTI